MRRVVISQNNEGVSAIAEVMLSSRATYLFTDRMHDKQARALGGASGPSFDAMEHTRASTIRSNYHGRRLAVRVAICGTEKRIEGGPGERGRVLPLVCVNATKAPAAKPSICSCRLFLP